MRETADQRRTKAGLELMELRAIDDAGDDLAHIKRLARVHRDHPIQLARLVFRRLRRLHHARGRLGAIEGDCDLTHQRQCVQIVLRQVIGHTGQAGVHVAAAEVLGADHLAGGGLHQRRTTEKNSALVLDDDGLVTHGGHIGAACGARPHHHRHLRDAQRRHIGLVVEDAPEVVAVGEDLILIGQVGTTGIDQVQTRQPVLLRHFLGPQVLLNRHGVVGAALHCGVVAHDHAVDPADAADTGNQASARRVAVVHTQGRQRRQLEKRGAGVKQHLHPVARQQFAARRVTRAGGFAATRGSALDLHAQVVDQGAHGTRIGLEISRTWIELRLDGGHGSVRCLR